LSSSDDECELSVARGVKRIFFKKRKSENADVYVCMCICNHGYFNILSSFYHFLKDRKSRNLSDFALVQDDFS